MTLLLTHSTETPLPELPLPLHRYCLFTLRERDAYLTLYGHTDHYRVPRGIVQNFEYSDTATARAVCDALNYYCLLAARLMR